MSDVMEQDDDVIEPVETEVCEGQESLLDVPSVELAVPDEPELHGTPLLHFTDADVEAIRDTVASDLSDAQFHVFLRHAQHIGLDPMSKQIYAWVDRGKMVTMVSIDGLRLVRDRSGKYAGAIGPMWCGPDGVWLVDEEGDGRPWLANEAPAAARFGVLRHDHQNPTWGIATWEQYGRSSGLWAKGGGPHMLAKCAEAIASRMAFPHELGGVYTSDEIPEAVEISREGSERRGGGSGKRRGNGGKRARAAEPASELDVTRAMGMFNALPDEGRQKLEDRWQQRLDDWSGGERPGTLDDGALFEVPKAWFDVIAPVIEKAIHHYGIEPFDLGDPAQPAQDQDDIVDAEIVEDDADETE